MIHELKKALKLKHLNFFEIIGIYCILLLSKEIFKNNSDVSEFVRKTIGISLPIYVAKSRTLMIARCVRIISTYNEEQQHNLCDRCYDILNTKEEKVLLEVNSTKSKQKKSENEKLTIWLRGLHNDR